MNNGDIDPADFEKWFDFANCLKSALEIIEGQAHFPEAKNLKTIFGVPSVVWDEQPYEDDGTLRGNKMTDDFVLAGLEVGASKTSKVFKFSTNSISSLKIVQKLICFLDSTKKSMESCE